MAYFMAWPVIPGFGIALSWGLPWPGEEVPAFPRDPSSPLTPSSCERSSAPTPLCCRPVWATWVLTMGPHVTEPLTPSAYSGCSPVSSPWCQFTLCTGSLEGAAGLPGPRPPLYRWRHRGLEGDGAPQGCSWDQKPGAPSPVTQAYPHMPSSPPLPPIPVFLLLFLLRWWCLSMHLCFYM